MYNTDCFICELPCRKGRDKESSLVGSSGNVRPELSFAPKPAWRVLVLAVAVRGKAQHDGNALPKGLTWAEHT